jgi:hypothetical protein
MSTEKSMRGFNGARIALWLWLLLTLVLWSRQFWHASFHPAPNTAHARLFLHPEIAVLEVGAVVMLLMLTAVIQSRPSWIVTSACLATWLLAFYHLVQYSIGVDLILMYALMPVLIEKRGKPRP